MRQPLCYTRIGMCFAHAYVSDNLHGTWAAFRVALDSQASAPRNAPAIPHSSLSWGTS